MTHDDRAYAVEAMIGVHLQTASHPEVVKLLAAEFAAVEDATIGACINDAQELERVLQGRIAALESEVSRLRAGLESIVALAAREPFDGEPTYAPAGFQAMCILGGSTRHLERVQEQSIALESDADLRQRREAFEAIQGYFDRIASDHAALLKMLRDAARHGLATRGEIADPEGWCDTIAKRVWEGR